MGVEYLPCPGVGSTAAGGAGGATSGSSGAGTAAARCRLKRRQLLIGEQRFSDTGIERPCDAAALAGFVPEGHLYAVDG